ncbi:MAG: hypothetical protein ABI777_05885 [Betaproteobacteria bacterium]
MQAARYTRTSLAARLASGMPTCVGVSAYGASNPIAFAAGANLWSKATGPSGMQCNGGPVSVPGDDV